MKAIYKKYILHFNRPSGTSRGVMTEKETWFLLLEENGTIGVGECGLLRGLSIDDRPDYEEKLQWVCENINLGKDKLWDTLLEFPSIQFGVEMAFLSLQSKTPFELFSSNFTEGKSNMLINGLVWMGVESFMKTQIEEKLAQGFSCIKLKIGAIDFEKELGLLRFIRQNFDPKTIEIRVDANGAFNSNEALNKLIQLSEFKIHKESLLAKIKPKYIILKPSLVGGFKGTLEWIELAEKHNIGWWITSALESNIGLNAIAQFTYTLNNTMPQGLGTGGLYTNNFDCPLEIVKGHIGYNLDKNWDVSNLGLQL